MSTAMLMKYIDRTGTMAYRHVDKDGTDRSLYYKVRTLDAKSAYGRTRLLVEPLNGSGQQWVELGANLTLDGE